MEEEVTHTRTGKHLQAHIYRLASGMKRRKRKRRKVRQRDDSSDERGEDKPRRAAIFGGQLAIRSSKCLPIGAINLGRVIGARSLNCCAILAGSGGEFARVMDCSRGLSTGSDLARVKSAPFTCLASGASRLFIVLIALSCLITPDHCQPAHSKPIGAASAQPSQRHVIKNPRAALGSESGLAGDYLRGLFIMSPPQAGEQITRVKARNASETAGARLVRTPPSQRPSSSAPNRLNGDAPIKRTKRQEGPTAEAPDRRDHQADDNDERRRGADESGKCWRALDWNIKLSRWGKQSATGRLISADCSNWKWRPIGRPGDVLVSGGSWLASAFRWRRQHCAPAESSDPHPGCCCCCCCCYCRCRRPPFANWPRSEIKSLAALRVRLLSSLFRLSFS